MEPKVLKVQPELEQELVEQEVQELLEQMVLKEPKEQQEQERHRELPVQVMQVLQVMGVQGVQLATLVTVLEGQQEEAIKSVISIEPGAVAIVYYSLHKRLILDTVEQPGVHRQ
jgi:ABC-type ATPase with predicted acetyltransferase domain